MADGFVDGDVALQDPEVSRLGLDRTESLAFGTRLLVSELLSVLFHEGLEGSLDQAEGGRRSDLLHSSKGQSGRLVRDPSRNDFSPVGSEVLQLVELFGREMGLCHNESCLEVTSWGENRFLVLL
jgi:hypothetical protein